MAGILAVIKLNILGDKSTSFTIPFFFIIGLYAAIVESIIARIEPRGTNYRDNTM